jgi:8-amino-3,8-dideoxy-alpha-D-manno-octulosonate transaminase
MGEKVQFPREFPGVHYYGKEEEEAVLRVIRHRSPFRYYGASFLQEAHHLEEEFRTRVGRKYAQALCSGTNALGAALAALEVGPGQEVLIPGFLWVSTVGTVVRAGAIPVLVEIDESFNMSPEDLKRKITKKSTVVVPVHMCGVPANMPAIMEVARKHGLRVLEDCAQTNGGSIGGKAVGTFGDIGMFSFQMNKMITAGEGGLLVTDDETLYLRANAAHDLGVPWAGEMPDDSKGIHLWGAGARMSELAAAVLRAQLTKLDAIAEHSRVSKHRIQDALLDLDGVAWRRVDDPAGECGAFMIAMFEGPDEASGFASRSNGVGLPCTYLPDYGLHVYSNILALVKKSSNSPDGFPWTHPKNTDSEYGYGKGALPETDALLARSVVLPVPSCLSREQEEEFAALFRKAWRG